MLDRQRKIIIAYLLADSLLQLTTIDLEIMYELRFSFIFSHTDTNTRLYTCEMNIIQFLLYYFSYILC